MGEEKPNKIFIPHLIKPVGASPYYTLLLLLLFTEKAMF